jgi:arylsulfatase A-like enzyme
MVEQFDPHLVFVNLGDIDRMGHSDLTGTTLKAARTAALLATDRQVQRLTDHLKATGAWRHSMVVVLADHSMDWSLPHRLVQLAPLLEADPLLAGRVRIADNGGADLLYWTGSGRRRDEAVARMRRIAEAHPGVLRAHDRREPALRLGPEAGDVVVYCRSAWRFSDPDVYSNPIPGNHGHPATAPIPFFLSGGHPAVPRRATRTAVARTLDVAPTLSEFFGVGGPGGGYDGRSRL